MIGFVTALRWLARLGGLASLVIGVLLWTGSGASGLNAHILLGFLMTFVLIALGLIGLMSRLKPILPTVALLWAMSLPVLGFAQLRTLPGQNHIIIQVLHLLLGIGAIGLAEAVGAKIVRTARG